MLYEHEINIRVRYCETDAMGRLHHAQFLNYFETGRTEQLRSLGQTYREFENTGLFLVVIKMAVQYRAAANYDDLLRLVTRTMGVTTVRIDHEYKLFCDHQLIATAQSTLACVDAAGRPQRLPEWLRIEA
ncbi:MAG: thioesterase family protein [Pirellulales bacterium]